MGKRFTALVVAGILVSGLTLTGHAAQASSLADSTRASRCKQISTLLEDINGWKALAGTYLRFYDTFDANGDDANATKSLDSAGKYLKRATKLVKIGSSKAKNPEMKLEFKRWYNVLINDLDNGGALEEKSVLKIESLLIDGKC